MADDSSALPCRAMSLAGPEPASTDCLLARLVHTLSRRKMVCTPSNCGIIALFTMRSVTRRGLFCTRHGAERGDAPIHDKRFARCDQCHPLRQPDGAARACTVLTSPRLVLLGLGIHVALDFILEVREHWAVADSKTSRSRKAWEEIMGSAAVCEEVIEASVLDGRVLCEGREGRRGEAHLVSRYSSKRVDIDGKAPSAEQPC